MPHYLSRYYNLGSPDEVWAVAASGHAPEDEVLYVLTMQDLITRCEDVHDDDPDTYPDWTDMSPEQQALLKEDARRAFSNFDGGGWYDLMEEIMFKRLQAKAV